jgi:hypothetical protein
VAAAGISHFEMVFHHSVSSTASGASQPLVSHERRLCIHDRHIYNKVVDWFAVIGKELASPVVLPENTYNMDETGILLKCPQLAQGPRRQA